MSDCLKCNELTERLAELEEWQRIAGQTMDGQAEEVESCREQTAVAKQQRLFEETENSRLRTALGSVETMMWDLALCLAGWQTGARRNDEWINRVLQPANAYMKAKQEGTRQDTNAELNPPTANKASSCKHCGQSWPDFAPKWNHDCPKKQSQQDDNQCPDCFKYMSKANGLWICSYCGPKEQSEHEYTGTVVGPHAHEWEPGGTRPFCKRCYMARSVYDGQQAGPACICRGFYRPYNCPACQNS